MKKLATLTAVIALATALGSLNPAMAVKPVEEKFAVDVECIPVGGTDVDVFIDVLFHSLKGKPTTVTGDAAIDDSSVVSLKVELTRHVPETGGFTVYDTIFDAAVGPVRVDTPATFSFEPLNLGAFGNAVKVKVVATVEIDVDDTGTLSAISGSCSLSV